MYEGRTHFTDVDHALEEAQFLVEQEKRPHSVVVVRNSTEQRIFVVPTELVVQVEILETFNPV